MGGKRVGEPVCAGVCWVECVRGEVACVGGVPAGERLGRGAWLAMAFKCLVGESREREQTILLCLVHLGRGVLVLTRSLLLLLDCVLR